MKLNNIIVSSIVDLGYIFKLYPLDITLLDFWKNRHLFIRDCSPNNMVYWNSTVESWYFDLKEWITYDSTKENSNNKIIDKGIQALMSICNIERCHESTVRNILLNKTNLDNQIITVFAGEDITLVSEPNSAGNYKPHVCLKKIEVIGDYDQFSKVIINNENVCFEDKTINMQGGECRYAVFCDGVWIDILPNKLAYDNIELKLINKPLQFGSTLHICRRGKHNSSHDIDDVIAIAFYDKANYMYLDTNGNIKGVNIPPSLRTFAFKPVLIKGNQDSSMAFAISENGTLKSSNSINEINEVIYAEFRNQSVEPIKSVKI